MWGYLLAFYGKELYTGSLISPDPYLHLHFKYFQPSLWTMIMYIFELAKHYRNMKNED